MVSKLILAVLLAVCIADVFCDQCDSLPNGGMAKMSQFLSVTDERMGNCGPKGFNQKYKPFFDNNGRIYKLYTGMQNMKELDYFSKCMMRRLRTYCKRTARTNTCEALMKSGNMAFGYCRESAAWFCYYGGC